jgi:lipopolysaccharide heptosyltransferase I
LIVKLSSIGDVVMTTPVAKALRTAFPDSHIAWVVDDKSQDVLIGNPYLDEVIVWNRRAKAKRLRERFRGFVGGLAEVGRELRARNFDIAIDFQGLLRSALVARLSWARCRVGYDNAREGATLLYDVRLPSHEHRARGPQQYMDTLQFLDIVSEDLDMCVPIGKEDREFADSFLVPRLNRGAGDVKPKKIVSLCPATTWLQKHWTEEGWARLADLLVSKYDALPVFLGSGADADLIGRICGMMEHHAIDAAGKTSLKQAAAIIERSDALVAVDTGLMHIGLALRRPTVGIFGPTRWRHLPKPETFTVVVKEFPCMPCLRHPTCRDFDCMKAISPEDILASVEPWLTGKREAQPKVQQKTEQTHRVCNSNKTTPKSEKVVLLSYYRHQARTFDPMAKALSKYVTAQHLRVYPLTPERAVTSILRRDTLDPEQIENITCYYRLKKTLSRPEIDTPRWRARLRRRAIEWYRLFRKKLEGADTLVVWNGFSIPLGAAVAAAKSLGIKTIFCENGVLPETMAMDPQGINYANSITWKPSEFYESITMDPQKAKDLMGITLRQRPLRKASRDVRADCDDDKPLPERCVLFAMQVHDDTQVVLFSPRFHCLKEAVRYTSERLNEYNARTGDTLKLVVKEHPSDFGRVDYSALRASLPGVYFLRRKPISEIITHAQAVITLNSSVGVEGLLHLRPVITLADAFYNIPGMVYHLGTEDDLADVLAEALGKPVNTELITKFLYFMRYEYLVPTPRDCDGRVSFEAAAERVLDIMYDRLAWLD